MEQFCAICSKSIPVWLPGDLLNKNIKDIIDDLNITLVDKPTSGDRFICQTCLAKVHRVFDFKCTCIYSEDLLDPYIKEDNYKINLKDVYKREVKMLDENNNDEVCRLCMNLYRKESVVPLSTILEQPSYLALFRKYIPQVSLDAVANPVLCKTCVFRLGAFKTFFPPTLKLAEHLEPSKQKQGSTEVKESKHLKLAVGVTTEQEEIDICNSILKEFQFSISLAGEVSINTSNICDSDDKISEISNNGAVMRIFECLLCKYQTVVFRQLWKHSERHMPTKIFKCIFCTYITRHESKFITHDKKHSPSCPYTFPCPTCKGFKEQEIKGHVCFNCKNMSIKAKKNILQDLSVKQDLNCDQCSAKLYHRRCLFYHENNHLIAAHLSCEWCSLELDSEKALKQHVKLIKCNRCPLVLKCKTHYREHQKQHFAKKQCRYCEQEVRFVLQHTMNAQDMRLHRCSMCAYMAPCINILKRHKEVVHDRLRCCHCKFSSCLFHDFEKHMEDHRTNGEKFYRCKICPVVSKKKYNIKTHMFSVHKISSSL